MFLERFMQDLEFLTQGEGRIDIVALEPKTEARVARGGKQRKLRAGDLLAQDDFRLVEQTTNKIALFVAAVIPHPAPTASGN